MEELQAILNATPPEKLFEFPVLQPADHQLIGTFIQLFNYVDLNLRRSIETFARANLLQGEAAKKYPRIHSPLVANAVQDAVRAMDRCFEDVPEAIRILEILERRRELRNLLGHWAARRIGGHDAIVLISKDERDAIRVGGTYLDSGVCKTAILDLTDVRGVLTNELIPFEKWLALKTSEWRKRFIAD